MQIEWHHVEQCEFTSFSEWSIQAKGHESGRQTDSCEQKVHSLRSAKNSIKLFVFAPFHIKQGFWITTFDHNKNIYFSIFASRNRFLWFPFFLSNIWKGLKIRCILYKFGYSESAYVYCITLFTATTQWHQKAFN